LSDGCSGRLEVFILTKFYNLRGIRFVRLPLLFASFLHALSNDFESDFRRLSKGWGDGLVSFDVFPVPMHSIAFKLEGFVAESDLYGWIKRGCRENIHRLLPQKCLWQRAFNIQYSVIVRNIPRSG